MNIETLAHDIESLCDDEAALGSTGHLANVRHILGQLASYMARREQAIEARMSGMIETACGIETRAEAHVEQIAIDASAMVRPGDPTPPKTEPCHNCSGIGAVIVDASQVQCGECEGDGFRTLDEQDEAMG